MFSHRIVAAATLFALTAATTPAGAAPRAFRSMPPLLEPGASLAALANLDYSNGFISSFAIAHGSATLTGSFRVGSPAKLGENGIAVDASGLLYTAVDAPNGKPCSACFEVLQPNGTVVAQVPAPALGGSLQPALQDLALDAAGDVFVADAGQQAAYFFRPTKSGFSNPVLIESGSDTASIAVSPNAQFVFISGDFGLGGVRVYARASGSYQPGACFDIGAIALIGGSADDAGDVASVVDGVRGLVSISNANGKGGDFAVPDPDAELGSVAFSHSAALLYVADHKHEQVYAFARPSGGWTAHATPALAATYTGFKQLNIIAVPL